MYLDGSYSKQLTAMLAFAGGFAGILGGVVGLIYASDFKDET